MLQLCVSLFAVLLTDSTAYKCCPPQRWTAKTFFTSLELNNNWPNFVWQHGEFYQDATNERSVEVFEKRYDGIVKHLKIISDYKTKLRYRVNSDKNICSVEYNNEPFHTYCIRDTATKRFQVKLGFGNNSLEATAYYDESNLQNGKYQTESWYLVNEACIPLQGDRTGLDKDLFLDTKIIGSITSGFDDSIFDIPSICPTVVPPMGRSEEYVDAASQRYASISNFSLEDTQREVKIIADYKKGRKYTINLKKNTCTVKKLNLPYAKFCIQDSYKKAFDIMLGFGDNSLSGEVYTEDYSGIGPDANSKIGTAVLVTKECIPVQTDIYGLKDYNLLQSTGFGTYTTDFDDSIFDIPSFCPSCTESTAPDVPTFDEIRQQWANYVKV